jgi:shikimate kinase
MNRIIVLGAPLTGKTTLTLALRSSLAIPVLDFDEELLKRNDGKYPANYPVLNERLKKEAISTIAKMHEVIFFAFEIHEEQLRVLRLNGFTVVQLTAPVEELAARNQVRLQNDPENDAFRYVTKNLESPHSPGLCPGVSASESLKT